MTRETTTATAHLSTQPKNLARLVEIIRRCERIMEVAKDCRVATEHLRGGGDETRGHAG
jgi:hypothetical protein